MTEIQRKTPSEFSDSFIFMTTKSYTEFMEVGNIEQGEQKILKIKYKDDYSEKLGIQPMKNNFSFDPYITQILGFLGGEYIKSERKEYEPFEISLNHLIAKMKGNNERLTRITQDERKRVLNLLSEANDIQIIIQADEVKELLEQTKKGKKGKKEKEQRAEQLRPLYISRLIRCDFKNTGAEIDENGRSILTPLPNTSIIFTELPKIIEYAHDLKQIKATRQDINDFSKTLNEQGELIRSGKRNNDLKLQVQAYLFCNILPQLHGRVQKTEVKLITIKEHLEKAGIEVKHTTRFKKDVLEVLERLKKFEEISGYETAKSRDGKNKFHKLILYKTTKK